MRIITNFKFKNAKYINRLVKKGDVALTPYLKYIRTDYGWVSEFGTTITNTDVIVDYIFAVIKRDFKDNLEDLLVEGEKRCNS